MKKELRKGKVLVDWSQNDEHKTTIAVYSLRAREHPTVSTPVKWEEVEQLLKKKDATLLVFEAGQVLKRVEKMGDLFEPTLKLKQKLPKLAGDVGAGDLRPCGERSSRVFCRRCNWTGNRSPGRKQRPEKEDGAKPAAKKKPASGKKPRKI